MYGLLSLNLECSCRIEARFDKLPGVDHRKREYFMDSLERTRSAMQRDFNTCAFLNAQEKRYLQFQVPDDSKAFRTYTGSQDINVKLIVGIFRAELPARRAEDLLAQKGHEEL